MNTNPVISGVIQKYHPHTLTDKQKNESCSFCLENLGDGTPVYAHEGQGYLHPIHKICIQQWLERGSTCPDCSVKVVIPTNDTIIDFGEIDSGAEPGRSRRYIDLGCLGLSTAFVGLSVVAIVGGGFQHTTGIGKLFGIVIRIILIGGMNFGLGLFLPERLPSAILGFGALSALPCSALGMPNLIVAAVCGIEGALLLDNLKRMDFHPDILDLPSKKVCFIGGLAGALGAATTLYLIPKSMDYAS